MYEEENKKILEQEKQRRDRELNDIKKIVKTADGRRLYWRLLSECGIFKTSLADEHKIFFNEGKRVIGLIFLDDLMKIAPDSFNQMQREYISEQKSVANINKEKGDE